MRAAVIERYGEPPVVKDVDMPQADASHLIEVVGAPLNPVDISIASGKLYWSALLPLTYETSKIRRSSTVGRSCR